MKAMTLDDLKLVILNNPDLIFILKVIEQLHLNDCWLCAGTLRNFIWNYLSGNNQLDLGTDIDVVFYDHAISYEATLEIEKELQQNYPQYQWELKNQIYMHHHSLSEEKYQSSTDAIAKFPEKCTAIGTRFVNDYIKIFAPYGIEDIIQFKVQPTPYYLENSARKMLYNKRVQSKNWKDKWDSLEITLI